MIGRAPPPPRVPREIKTSLTETGVFCLIQGGGANSLGSRKGKENRGQSSKQRKPKEEDKNKSGVSQMVEDIAPSFHELNARLEEQQRQERGRKSTNGAEGSSHGEGLDESVTRDTTFTRSHTSSANGHK